jgi:cell division protein FtsZ
MLTFLPGAHQELKPRITVVGVGGAGGNAVNNMILSRLEGVEFIVANTDSQSLGQSRTERRIQLGNQVTQGLGAGSRPDVGRAAAEESLEEILGQIGGANMVFITAGMGGGTGSGAAPVIARAAREQGILTVGVVTKPFHFEGAHRMRTAEAAIEDLQQYVDTLIIIPNQNLFRVATERTTFADAFKMADDVLYSGVRGVTDLMIMPGLINLDFADIRTVMSEMGKAMMGTGEAEGDKRAIDAAEAAISNPLLDDTSMKGARGVLINITGGMDMTLFEVDEAANRIRDEVDPEANIIFGSTFDEDMSGKMRVSVVATGIDNAAQQRPPVGQPQLQVVSGRRVEQTAPPAANMPVAPAAAARVNGIPPRPALQQAPIPGANTPATFAPMQQAPMPGAAAAQAESSAAEPVAAAMAESPFIETPPAGTVPASQVPHELRPIDMVRPAAPRRDDAFIPPRPAEGAPRGNHPTAPERFVPPQPEKRGLFAKLFGGGPAPAPAPRQQTPTPPQQFAAQSRPAPVAPQQMPQGEPSPRAKPVQSEDEMLDIPAFLRRQAN